MATSAEAILAAAHRARRAASLHVEFGELAEAEALFQAIRDVEDTLRAATAEIRKWHRPLSVTGLGETYDRMRDAADRLVLQTERLRAEDDEQDDAETDEWAEFLDEHPELIDPELMPGRGVDKPDLTRTFIVGKIDPAALIDALRKAIEDPPPYHRRHGAAWSADVGAVLYPDKDMCVSGQVTSAHQKIAQALRRLADEGRVVRLRPRNGSGNLWTLEGFEPSEWVTKHYWISDAR